MPRGFLAAGALLLALAAADAALAEQSRKDVCDGDLRAEETRIRARALAEEKRMEAEAKRTGAAEEMPKLRAAIGRNLGFELSQARQNHEDCLKLP
jgi:hypothetical protein